MNFSGQSVLVTGGGAGIGKAIGLAFRAAGADVAFVDIDREAVTSTVQAADQAPGRSLAIVADCGDVASIDAMTNDVVKALGRLDILVNNAATTHHAGLMDISEADWDRIHRINSKGAFFCLQRAAREMIAQGGGRIINIASISGRGYAGTSNAAYAASKGAMITLTRIAAHQLAPHDINVNAICPGITMTDLLATMLRQRAAEQGIAFEEMVGRFASPIPLGRANAPEDIASMAIFLASTAARNITGQSYNVDGGLVMS